MKNKKYEEDLDLLEQLASLATKKNLSEIEFKKNIKMIMKFLSKFQAYRKKLLIKIQKLITLLKIKINQKNQKS